MQEFDSSEIEAHFHRYQDAFNSRDIDGCVACYTHPYFDVRTRRGDDNPNLRAAGDAGQPSFTVMTEEDSRSYFAGAMKMAEASKDPALAGARATPALMEAIPLGEKLALLLVDLQTVLPDGTVVPREPGYGASRRILYSLQLEDEGWKFNGYLALDPGFLGPGDIALS